VGGERVPVLPNVRCAPLTPIDVETPERERFNSDAREDLNATVEAKAQLFQPGQFVIGPVNIIVLDIELAAQLRSVDVIILDVVTDRCFFFGP